MIDQNFYFIKKIIIDSNKQLKINLIYVQKYVAKSGLINVGIQGMRKVTCGKTASRGLLIKKRVGWKVGEG